MAINIDDFIAAQQEAKSYLSRFQSAVSEFQETGNWMGGKYNVSMNPTSSPKNLTKESIDSLDEAERTRVRSFLGESSVSSRRAQLSADVDRAAFRAERKGMRVSQNITDVEDFSDEEYARLKSRTDELYKLDDAAYNDLFKKYNIPIPGTDDSVKYLTHSGAPELQGGALDPSRTIGDELNGMMGNTKALNRMQSSELSRVNEGNTTQLQKLQLAKEEFSTTGKISGELNHFTNDTAKGVDPTTGQWYSRSSDEVSQILDSNISEAQRLARQYGTLLDLSGGGEGGFISAAPASAGVHRGYFGRTTWGSGLGQVVKSVEEAGDISESTGGRGTAYLMRATNLNSSSILGAESYEIGLAGRNVPIAGLSSRINSGIRREGQRHADEIFPAWALEQLEKDSARVASGEIPLRQVYGEETSKLLGIGEGSADVIAPKDITPPKAFMTPELEQAKSYLARFESAVSEFKETGSFMAEKHDVVINPRNKPRNWTSQLMAEAAKEDNIPVEQFVRENFNDERFNARIAELREDVNRAGFRAERKGMRAAQNITDVEDFSENEFEALVKRNEEIKAMSGLERDRLFLGFEQTIPGTADEKLSYAIHAGAPELQGGKLDPNFTKGSDIIGSGAAGDTKAANLRHLQMAKLDKIRDLEADVSPGLDRRLEVARRQVGVAEEGGGFLSAGKPSGGMAGGYFGRTQWQGAAFDKVVTESSELATDLGRSTGGRGTLHLMRGVKDFTVSDSRFIGGDFGETPILGAHKPMAGLSSRGKAGIVEGGIEVSSGVQDAESILKRGLKDPSQRLAEDVQFAWMEKVIKEDSARVAAGQVPIREIYGETAYKMSFGAEEDTAAIAARVSSRTIPETIEEGLEKVVQRSGASSRLLGAATEASAAVAGGMNNSGALRGAGTALTVLRGLT
jgi:hypothetical protein